MRSRLLLFILALVFTLQLTGTALLCSGCSMMHDDGDKALRMDIAEESKYRKPEDISLEKKNITVNFEGNRLDLSLPIYEEYNRYYLPLTEIINNIDGELTFKSGKANINVNKNKIDLYTKDNYFVKNNKKVSLKKKALVADNSIYVSLFDLKKMLNLKVVWDEKNNSIGLFWNRDNTSASKQPDNGKPALIRFEDIAPEQRYATAESLEKLRIIFDYCYSRNIPIHLGWVPRYIDPQKNIDNDPAVKYSIHNANFIYTLDYLVDQNGLIGLHGYTHQCGDEVSINGIEFNGNRNTSKESIIKRLESAIDCAKKLDIPISFFESPHYAALPSQKKIMEQYFDNIYEYQMFYFEKNITKVNNGNRVVKYIPTPLGYVQGKGDTNNMINKIKNLNNDTLASLFFHPSIEFEFIVLTKNPNVYPSFKYDENSPLHRITNTFIESGYTIKNINH
ncbi:DUF2334 domain-containing protein [Ruminiclostridium papyrosolvens]|uniref:Copper amine oxidase-like N-terminal domain-containing protein n=1 Tax=Ruminiclostridium papyrosolvens C7 TaxID=1330534 RepID=U4R0N9_9FIRM|nr:DUF2334 domain-containing protein [Ruminiclostridium papyrosolvens]EPR11475.1 hypothetical protein L323_11720 [Ruminiclostridium papyrosolvens C7]